MKAADSCPATPLFLQKLDFSACKLNDYSRRYIGRMMPAIEYYVEIYSRCLDNAIAAAGKPLDQITLVDYGGDHGFLSLMAKERGVGQVIYVDFNPDAVETIHLFSDTLGYGPDVILQGDALVLNEWARREEVVPDILLGMDVIEHIYCLDDFFSAVFSLTTHVKMIFTTGSNPMNRRICRRLRKVMRADERLFWQRRRDFIARHNPDFSPRLLDYWATNTRGLNCDDILRAVDTNSPNLLSDSYNTCDPDTGSWTERILPFSDYRNLIEPYGATCSFQKGFCNTHRKGPKAFLSRWLNRRIDRRSGMRFAPFVFLEVNISQP